MYLLASTRPGIGKGKLRACTGHKTDGKEERRSLSMHFLLGGVLFFLAEVGPDGWTRRSFTAYYLFNTFTFSFPVGSGVTYLVHKYVRGLECRR